MAKKEKINTVEKELPIKITQDDMVKRIAAQNNISQTLAADIMCSFGEAASEYIALGYRVIVPSLGVLYQAKRAARMGRNPQTNEPVAVSAHNVVKFSISKALKEKINAKKK